MEYIYSAACSVSSRTPKRGIDAIVHHKAQSATCGLMLKDKRGCVSIIVAIRHQNSASTLPEMAGRILIPMYIPNKATKIGVKHH